MTLLTLVLLMPFHNSAADHSPAAQTSRSAATAIVRDDMLRAELLELAREDQAIRERFSAAVQANDAAFLQRMMADDTARSERLKEIVSRHGWPTPALVGRDGVDAAWTLLQHSPDFDWQASLLPVLEQAAARGDIAPENVAMLTDRVLVRKGLPQRYGSSLSFSDGRWVVDPIEDEADVDLRRAAVGLPPMAEYIRGFAEAYKAPVEWPRKRAQDHSSDGDFRE